MKIIQKLLRRISPSAPSPQPSPSLNTPEQWRAYWKTQGQPWRTEPEIGIKRQQELAWRLTIMPDIKEGIYPFRERKLSRADVEWLLATHGSHGPVDWEDESRQERDGLDLRGADLRSVDLSKLPLTRMRGGVTRDEWYDLTQEQRIMASVLMEGSYLRGAHLEGACLRHACLENANFRQAHLEGADLGRSQLKGANLRGTYLERTDLWGASLVGADLNGARLEKAQLSYVILADENYVGPQLADVHWDDTNLAVVEWSQLRMLGDEYEARQGKRNDGKKKDRGTRLRHYQRAIRANRQLAIALQAQGLNEQATRFAYRAQVLQRHALWFEMVQQRANLRQRGRALGAWLFSWFLFLLAGYGYKPIRSFFVYVLVIVGFTALFLGLDGHLAWYEAVVVSMTAFHGRGFSPSTFSPGDPLSIASAFEAFVGLIIEVTFIATLTQRFFNK